MNALLDAVPEDERRAILAQCRRLRFAKGEVIFREGDVGNCVHMLVKGTVAVRVSNPRGDIATIDVLRSGEAFGEQSLVGEETDRSATVVALEAVETMRLSRDDFMALLNDRPAVLQLVVAMLDSRLRAMNQAVIDALYLSSEARVYKRLAGLAELYHGHSSGAILITQDDLASMAGAVRQTVNRVLREAEVAGLIRLARGKIVVLDHEGVARRAR